MILRTRREMARTLEDVMSHAYAQLEEQQQLEAETSLLKTYLVEAHIPDPSHDTVHEALEGIFDARRMGSAATLRLLKRTNRFSLTLSFSDAAKSQLFTSMRRITDSGYYTQ